MFFIKIIATAFLAVFFMSSSIAQQGIETFKRTYMKTLLCAQHDDLVSDLVNYHQESRKWFVVNTKNELLELFTSDTTGSWTLIISNKQGESCGLVGGDDMGNNFTINNPSGDNL